MRVEEIDGVKLVKNLAVKMEEMFRKKAEATRVRAIGKMHYLFLSFILLRDCVYIMRVDRAAEKNNGCLFGFVFWKDSLQV